MSISNRSVDINELRSQAIRYFSENADIKKKVEQALNDLFYDAPVDVFGYLSEYFRKFARTSVISRVETDGMIYYDSKNQPSFQIHVYCIERNLENKIVTIEVPCYSNPDQIHDSSRIQQIQEDDVKRREELHDIISFINSNLTNILKTLSPYSQKEIDENLSKLYENKQNDYNEAIIKAASDELRAAAQSAELQQQMALDPNNRAKKDKSPTSPKQKQAQSQNKPKGSAGANASATEDTTPKPSPYFKGYHTISAISKAICMCSSQLNKKQLFYYICELANQGNLKEEFKFKLPKPLVTILQNGKGFNGKQSLIKEFILLPKNNVSIKEGLDLISKVHQNIRDTLYQSKTLPGAVNRCVTESGSLTCQLDTPQQGLDMVELAIQAVCGENANKLSLALNIGANELFDTDKVKYEIATGTLKLSDELVEIYADLVTKYPRIVLLIEPFSKKDQLVWYKLYTRIGKNCLIANTFNAYELKTNLNTAFNASLNQQQLLQQNQQDANSPIIMPLNFYKFENTLTISDFINNANEVKENNVLTGVSCIFNETSDSFITDLATGVQASYLKVGGFNRSERVTKLNRLLEIEKFLKDSNLLDETDDHSIQDTLGKMNFKIPSNYATLLEQAEEAKLTKGKK